jgi:two-component system phosphate regulon response regulator PhoB
MIILVVENDTVIRQASAAVLVRAGYQVDSVDGSQAAWEALQSCRYNLMITDNQMPGLTGIELVRKLRSARLVFPVIVASGGFGAEDLSQNQWLQPATVLPKPFTGDALLQMVTGILGRAGHASATHDSYSHWGLSE